MYTNGARNSYAANHRHNKKHQVGQALVDIVFTIYKDVGSGGSSELGDNERTFDRQQPGEHPNMSSCQLYYYGERTSERRDGENLLLSNFNIHVLICTEEEKTRQNQQSGKVSEVSKNSQ